ncbi:hypothetical protein GCM10010361_42800 [Streptomyces olivaceiscleroticus]|uniref:Uncharacterized protein n=1 Tax=Streptomyces olivaceiscleroticus TaxID=68245 RepID=A0ABN1ADN8_9ACTN
MRARPRAASAFHRCEVPVSLSWQAAAPYLPALAQAASAVTVPPDETHDRLDEITKSSDDDWAMRCSGYVPPSQPPDVLPMS